MISEKADKDIEAKENIIKDSAGKTLAPPVTIGIPVLNEEEHIERVISGFLNSTYPNLVEILVADGGSDDKTREIVENLSKKDARVRLLENPEKFQSFALNKMIEVAEGEVFLRADAHCEYGQEYIEKCIINLSRDGVKNTGGAARFLATNLVQAGTAIAVFSILGNGGAKHYNPEYEGYSDTVPMGCFYIEDLKKLNGFTESNHTNEDAEINYRLKKLLDGKIYISPEIVLQYYPRKSFIGLFKQYFKYGRGRYLTGSMHKGKIPFRSKAPFLFTGTMLLLLLIDNVFLSKVLGSVYILSACLLLLLFEALRLSLSKKEYFVQEVWKSKTKKAPSSILTGIYSFIILIIMHFAHFSGYGYQMLKMKFLVEMVGNIQKTQKIVQLSSVHPSNDTRVFHKMSKSLIDLGYDLDLLIQHPKDEVLEKVNIIALPIAFKKYDRLTKVIPIILKKSFRYEKGTIFQIHDSELILFGLVLKCFGYKIIYDAHENTPKDFLSKEWIPFIFRYPFSQIVSFLEYLADSFFDGIITTSAPITKRYKNKNLFEIRNYPKLDSSIRSICQVPFSEKKNQIIYVGGITERRGIIEMVKAMGILGQNFDLKLILGGKFAPPNLQEKVSILDGWEYCEFLGWLELNQLWSKVSESKIGLVVIQPFESHFTQLPVKLFEYMASGVPVVCSDFPMYREIVDNEKCGLLVDPTSPDKITEAVSWLLNNPTSAERMGQRGRKAVLEKLNWETEEKKLLNLYQRLIAN